MTHLNSQEQKQESQVDIILEPGDLLELCSKNCVMRWSNGNRHYDFTFAIDGGICVIFEPGAVVMFLGSPEEEPVFVKILYQNQIMYIYRNDLENWFSVLDTDIS